MRPVCERCGVTLSPDSASAMICSYECTFCLGCASAELNNVCPNCGGDLQRRPIRASTN
ncbi:MAG: DUF1272 domain-containing protein [Acidimicrobiales bacterium]